MREHDADDGQRHHGAEDLGEGASEWGQEIGEADDDKTGCPVPDIERIVAHRNHRWARMIRSAPHCRPR